MQGADLHLLFIPSGASMEVRKRVILLHPSSTGYKEEIIERIKQRCFHCFMDCGSIYLVRQSIMFLFLESTRLGKQIVPTVGLNIGRLEVSNTKLVFWDLGGQPGLRSIWEKYYEEAHAVMYVVDAACPSRFEDSKSALEKVLRHEDMQGAPLLILANKQDLANAVSAEELARYLDLKKLDERAYTFEAVSSYDGSGIKESVEWLVEVMERSKRTEMLRVRAGLTNLGSA
ncbi:ADP-ribosylation factor-like protein 3 isoform X2 [Diospyros lotus]|uniref:ADP-ribosylation factor-like protein 3 isoform X2 n=2 Tax=Diospyros lotus TaxID=55363 RepID=UPI002251B57A|nr:ADP-ribosylation factor-like protein 3 isoform X2 [Diospyros lotus]